MSRLSREQEAADRQFASEAASVLSVPVGEERLRIDAERLRNMPDPEWLLFRLLEPYGFASPVCSDLCSLIGRQGTFSGKVFHSEAFRAVTSGTSVIVVPASRTRDRSGVEVRKEGEYSIAGIRFSVTLREWKEGMPLRNTPGMLVFDSSALSFPFSVRLWENGDWLCPLGLRNSSGGRGRKKISDLFVDLGYSLPEKEVTPVVEPSVKGNAPGHVAALLWERIDDSFKVTEKTASVVVIERRP